MKRAFVGAVLIVIGLLVASAPGRAVSSLTFTYECADPSGAPTTLCDVYRDPDIHGGSFGTVLAHATTTGKRTLTAAIPDGSHRIAIRASAKVATGANTSVLVVTIPSTCQSGWAQLGYQSWWSATGEDPAFESRHEHIDNICVPGNNLVVNGRQAVPFDVQLHKQPPGAKLTRVRIKDYPGGVDRWYCTPSHVVAGCPTTWPKPDADGNVTARFSPTLDLTALSAGRHEFRFGVYVTQSDGKVQLLSSRTELCVRSCSPAYRSLTTFPLLQGNGSWYANDTIGYIDTRWRSLLPVAP